MTVRLLAVERGEDLPSVTGANSLHGQYSGHAKAIGALKKIVPLEWGFNRYEHEP